MGFSPRSSVLWIAAACGLTAVVDCTLLHPLGDYGRCTSGGCDGGAGATDSAASAPRSCTIGGAGAANDCANGTANCCEVLCVDGGTFDRSNDSSALATLRPFCVDRFEVTVGRFRNFIYADGAGYGTQVHPPAPGAGGTPDVPGTGWDPSGNASLAADTASLLATVSQCNGYAAVAAWSDSSPAGTLRPMNCIDWFTASAFCIWDGGRLLTEAEWNFVAAGGAQQRLYPWGSQPIDPSYAAYGCTEGAWDGAAAACPLTFLPPVGSYPTGNALWGHADLVGSVNEWTLDWYGPYPVPCASDCVNLTPGQTPAARVERGEDWLHSMFANTFGRDSDPPGTVHPGKGVRCAR